MACRRSRSVNLVRYSALPIYSSPFNSRTSKQSCDSKELQTDFGVNNALIYFGFNNKTEPILANSINTDASCPLVAEVLKASVGFNTFMQDIVGVSAIFNPIADQLTGMVGIGQSIQPDKPFGPPHFKPPFAPLRIR
jgi:hypothetical protein